jgi:hypothetical protein
MLCWAGRYMFTQRLQTPQDRQLALRFGQLLMTNGAALGAACSASFRPLVVALGTIHGVGDGSELQALYHSWAPCGRPLDYYSRPSSQWQMCRGSYPTTRGYTCGLCEQAGRPAQLTTHAALH